MARTTGPRRLSNRPRPKVPHNVWIVSWGYRDNDPSVTYMFSHEKYPSIKRVVERIDELLDTWIKEEADYYEESIGTIEDKLAVYGPFLESYIKTVKELRPNERNVVETDFQFYGEAYLPRE